MKLFSQNILRTLALTVLVSAVSLDINAEVYDETSGLYFTVSGTSATVTRVKGSDDAYIKYTGDVKIPSTITSNGTTYTVTGIAENAFNGNTGLTSITISEGVSSIGKQAFNRCSGLTSISIPKTITSIGVNAFGSCSKLAAVYIEDLKAYCEISFAESGTSTSPTSAAKAKLYVNNVLVEDLVIPDGTTSIGNYAFYKCSSIKSVTIPGSVKTIGKSAFNTCANLTSVTLSEGIETIGNSAFNSLNITTISIPSSVTSIGNSAFTGCKSLSSVELSEGLETIGENTFSMCTALTSITIPSTVTTINNKAFTGCTNLVSATFNGTKPPSMPTKTTNSIFSSCTNLKTINVPEGSESAYGSTLVLPSTVTPTTKTTLEAVTTGSTAWATGCLSYNAIVPTGTAYYVSAISDGKIVLADFPTIDGSTVIPALQGFIYNADAGSHTFQKYTGTATAVTDNLLTGVYGSTATFGANSVYVLSKISDSLVGFRLYTGTSMTTNHAYLKLDDSSAKVDAFTFSFDEPTGITSTTVEPQSTNSAIYNLQGQRVSQTQRGGLYIQNGKKFIAK